ncbi:MAG TPA: methyltransferase, partial [Erysipelotrichaceae bacterium]|nr:methyltransferase [Erysipelotrichaceae bacterium]
MNNDLKHYYVDDQKELTNRKEITFRFLDIDFKFTTADSIFSKDKVDAGSTLLLQLAVESGIKDLVLDYGCGYGVVGVTLAKLGHSIIGIDVTDRAIKLSEINAKQNQVKASFEKIINNNVSKYNNTFNTVLLNPPIRAGKVVIYEMFDNAYNFLLPGGVLYIVMRKQHGAKSAIKKLETLFNDVTVINKSKGYYII